jgi:hypothetical protein
MLLNLFYSNSLTLKCIALLLCGSIIFSSCNSGVVSQESLTIGETKKYTGEELFRGIFFMQGEVAKSIPMYEDMLVSLGKDKTSEEDINKFSNEIIGYMKVLDPNFFVEFQRGIESKNPYQIRETLNIGIVFLVKTMRNIPQYRILIEESIALAGKIDYKSFIDANGKLDRNKLNKELQNAIAERGNSSFEKHIKQTKCSAIAACALGVYLVAAVSVALVVNVAVVMGVWAVVAVFNPRTLEEGGAKDGDAMLGDLEEATLVAQIASISK